MNAIFLAAALMAVSLSHTSVPAAPHVVMMIGEDEYKTWETLPEFGRTELEPHGYRVTIVHADASEKHNFPGIVEALRTADLLILSVRRRTPPAEQLDAVRAYLAAGKPLIGIRTACHAFALRPTDPPAVAPLATWQEFDPEVLGGHYTNHYGVGATTVVTAVAAARKHPILQGVAVPRLNSVSSLYKVSPLERGTTPLLTGTIAGQPSEPVAWINRYGSKQGRIFYTSLGHPDDFRNAEFRRLLRNAVAWAVGR